MELLLPALKYKFIKHLQSHNFKNGNNNLWDSIQALENKYRSNPNYNQWLNKIRNTINYCSSTITTRSFDGKSKLEAYENDQQLFIESEFHAALCNIDSVEFLKALVFFFEPDLCYLNSIQIVEEINAIV